MQSKCQRFARLRTASHLSVERPGPVAFSSLRSQRQLLHVATQAQRTSRVVHHQKFVTPRVDAMTRAAPDSAGKQPHAAVDLPRLSQEKLFSFRAAKLHGRADRMIPWRAARTPHTVIAGVRRRRSVMAPHARRALRIHRATFGHARDARRHKVRPPQASPMRIPASLSFRMARRAQLRHTLPPAQHPAAARRSRVMLGLVVARRARDAPIEERQARGNRHRGRHPNRVRERRVERVARRAARVRAARQSLAPEGLRRMRPGRSSIEHREARDHHQRTRGAPPNPPRPIKQRSHAHPSRAALIDPRIPRLDISFPDRPRYKPPAPGKPAASSECAAPPPRKQPWDRRPAPSMRAESPVVEGRFENSM